MKRIFFLVVFAVFSFGLSAEEKDTAAIFEEWEETLNYGIDSEVLNVIAKLQERREERFNAELVAVFGRSLNIDVRKKILEFFTEVKYAGATDAAFAVLSNYEDEDAEVLRAIVLYFIALEFKKAVPVFTELIEADNILLAGSSIRAVGKLGGPEQGKLLLEKLNDPELDENRKPDIILALGELKTAEATDALLAILEDEDESRIWRMNACAALGEIGDTRAVPVMKKIFSEKDPLLKASAAAALGNFQSEEVVTLLIESLKDAHWKVRVSACQGLAHPHAAKALEILKYKALKDPEARVRMEALKALSGIGNTDALVFLRDFFEDKKTPEALREVVFTILVEDHLGGQTINIVERVIRAEKDEKDKRMVEVIAKKLSITDSSDLRGIYDLFLESSYFVLRISAIRGIVRNKYTDMRGKLEKIAENDPADVVKTEAKQALEKL
ncbi:MAG: HEAT repeat domain-containing protein [Spirochaetales bacterium]|nr:HEAT repeat domain-containing protein [Spirochaetales bacterium]